MKVFRLVIIIIVMPLFLFNIDGYGPDPQVDFIVNSISQQYKKQGTAFEFVPICNTPVSMYESYGLPYLDKGKIVVVDQVGIVWCSGLEIGDTGYVVIKTKAGYTVQWWKKGFGKLYVYKIQYKGKDPLPDTSKSWK